VRGLSATTATHHDDGRIKVMRHTHDGASSMSFAYHHAIYPSWRIDIASRCRDVHRAQLSASLTRKT
jgi:hypothetical protein